MNFVRINLGLSPSMLKRLDAFAQRKGLDRNNAIRQFIAEGLEADDQRRGSARAEKPK